MLLEISKEEILALVIKQLNNIFTYDKNRDEVAIVSSFNIALERAIFCFSHNKNKYYSKNEEVYFNPFHSGQYSIFLYYLSHTVFSLHQDCRNLADRIYYLNKSLNCVDLFYEVKLPTVFFLDHPVGTILGRAEYGEGFRFTQNCTVGNNKGVYPIIGSNVTMMSGSQVLGQCKIGDNVFISAGAYVLDIDIPTCSIVFGRSPNLIIKHKDKSYFDL